MSWSSSWCIITFLVHQVIKQDYIIKGSGAYNDRSPSRQVTILPSLVAIGTVCIGDNAFNLSRDLARPRDQSVKWLYSMEAIKVSYHPAKGKYNGFRLSRDLARPSDQSAK